MSRAPVNGAPGWTIPWATHVRAYETYAARFGTDQTVERIAERGGFGTDELDAFVPGWRAESQMERCGGCLPGHGLLHNQRECQRCTCDWQMGVDPRGR